MPHVGPSPDLLFGTSFGVSVKVTRAPQTFQCHRRRDPHCANTRRAVAASRCSCCSRPQDFFRRFLLLFVRHHFAGLPLAFQHRTLDRRCNHVFRQVFACYARPVFARISHTPFPRRLSGCFFLFSPGLYSEQTKRLSIKGLLIERQKSDDVVHCMGVDVLVISRAAYRHTYAVLGRWGYGLGVLSFPPKHWVSKKNYPSTWPATAYKNQLSTPAAHVVACKSTNYKIY